MADEDRPECVTGETSTEVDARLRAVISVKNRRIEELEDVLREVRHCLDDPRAAIEKIDLALQQLPPIK